MLEKTFLYKLAFHDTTRIGRCQPAGYSVRPLNAVYSLNYKQRRSRQNHSSDILVSKKLQPKGRKDHPLKKSNVQLTNIRNRVDHPDDNELLIFNAYTVEDASSKSLYVCQSGIKKWRSPGWISGPAIYDHYIIHFLINGEGTYRCRGQKYPIQAGDLFLIEPYTEVSYQADVENPYQYYWVGFNGIACHEILSCCGFTETKLVLSAPDHQLMTDHMSAIASLRNNTMATQLDLLGHLYQIFSSLVQQEKQPDHRSSRYYYDAVAYIRDHACATTITAEDVAAHVGIERSHLYRIFKENGTVTVKEMILAVRMEKAKLFLNNTDQSIEYVANCAGFKNVSHFCQLFRKIEGISPYQYRLKERDKTI